MPGGRHVLTTYCGWSKKQLHYPDTGIFIPLHRVKTVLRDFTMWSDCYPNEINVEDSAYARSRIHRTENKPQNTAATKTPRRYALFLSR
jgi:hypothetical protein